jgi:hypothetical protein
MKYKTIELTGEKLNLAVHLALAKSGQELLCVGFPELLAYSTSWRLAGPIIERERIALVCPSTGDFWEARKAGSPIPATYYRGPTPTIAAMRCFVSDKIGDEVDL